MTILELLADIDMSNNGYLFAPTLAQLDIAYKHRELVTVERGNIKRCSTKIQYYPDPKSKPVIPADNFDYEAAILARQYCPN